MNYTTAFKLLEMDLNMADKNFNLTYLKNKYRKQALRHHPDKNGNTQESNEKFTQIKEAYDFLKREMPRLEEDFGEEQKNDDTSSPVYMDILHTFMKGLTDGKYNEFIIKIVKDIVIGCKNISVKLFEDLDKESSLGVYTFLSKYRYIFHLNDELLEKIKHIVLTKCEHDIIYKLNPSIDDLFENNVYKLFVEDKLYLVPLWHSELYFDGSGCEIIVLCEPELPKNIQIDEDSNIYYEIEVPISKIENAFGYDEGENEKKNENEKEKNYISIFIGKKEIHIPINQLHIQRQQYYRIPKEGFTRMNENSMYDITEKGDIIVKITFVKM